MKPIDATPRYRMKCAIGAASRGRSYVRCALVLGICLCLTNMARVALASDPPIASDSPTLIHVKVTSTDSVTLARQLVARGFDVLPGSVESDSFELIVSRDSLALLNRMGLAPLPIAVGRPFRQIKIERSGGEPPEVPPGYPDLAEILAQLNTTAAAFPAICRVVDLTETYGAPPTFEGRHMFAIKISDNVEQDEDEPATLVVSNHHARELVTPVIALHAIQQLTTRYGTDSVITEIVNENEIWIAPTWNPDGYEYVFNVDNLWRRNRRVFPVGVGVDLNRNHLVGWNTGCSGSDDVFLETYKGPVPASESETRTMMIFSSVRNFAKVIDYHSFGRHTVWGYGCLSHPFERFLMREAEAISQAHGYGITIQPGGADGEHFQYQLGLHGAHAFLVETSTQFQPLYSSAVTEASQVFGGVIAALQRPIPVSGHVTDAMTGEPLVARISLDTVNFQNCETNQSAGPFGRYHAFVPEGEFILRFCAAGYLPQTHSVIVSAEAGTVLDVALEPGLDPACEASIGEDCNGNLIEDACELSIGLAADCNDTGVLDECELAESVSPDCNQNRVPDECDIASGVSTDLDNNGIPDECEPDCNGNDRPDALDIFEGISEDCTGNGVPDECDIDGGTSPDCNGNDIPDECDIASGLSEDCTGDETPDECEPDCNGNGAADSCDIQDGASKDSDGRLDECCFVDEPASEGCNEIEYVYWSTLMTDKTAGISAIYRAPIDGEGQLISFAPSRDIELDLVNHKMYWVNTTNDRISRSDLTGTNREDIIGGLANPRGLSLDLSGGKVYWADSTTGVHRANLNGSNQENLVSGLDFSLDVAVDAVEGKVYWTDRLADVIQRSNLDGTEVETVLNTDRPRGIQLDLCAGKVYWTAGDIRRANLDGTDVEVLVEMGGERIALDIPAGKLYFSIDAFDHGELWRANLDGTNLEQLGFEILATAYGIAVEPTNYEDCNANGVTDACETASGISPDCNGNETPDSCDPDCNANLVPDECDITNGTSVDCNASGTPDACEIAELVVADCNGNGIPDECEGLAPQPPSPEAPAFSKNRFLSFTPGNPASDTAIRVTFVDLPSPFDQFNDQVMWVGLPRLVSENGASVDPLPDFPSFAAATLQCEPLFTDWSKSGLVHVFHEFVVPGGSYDVQAIPDACDVSIESSYSVALSLSTAGWGDTLSDLGTVPPGPPDGAVNIVDALGVIGRFASQEGSIAKARADLEPGCIDLTINITDVLAAIKGFQGLAYPFEPTSLELCESPCAFPSALRD